MVTRLSGLEPGAWLCTERQQKEAESKMWGLREGSAVEVEEALAVLRILEGHVV